MVRLGKRDVMARFGARLKNVRWSWDGVTDDGSVVFIGWADEVVRSADGTPIEYRLVKDVDAPQALPGAAERVGHVRELLNAEAAGYLVLATAKDPSAVPREIESIDERLYTVALEPRGAAVVGLVVGAWSTPMRDDGGDEVSPLDPAPPGAPTVQAQLINARRGQGLFRARVELIERGCRLTGVTDRSHLRASHIKPWRTATNAERLDGHNGLLLAPHADHLFDQGFVSFTDDGTVLLSAALAADVVEAWHLDPRRNVGPFSARQRHYLAYHRAEVFRSPATPR